MRVDKAQLKFELSENINQPKFGFVKNNYFIADINRAQLVENIRELKNQFSEYFIPDEYKIEGQTRSYKQYLNENEYM